MADPAQPRLRVRVTDGRGRPLAVAGLGRWLATAAPARARGEVTIALITNAAMRTLNSRYREADYATDVLSFPSDERGVLGDIAIARGVATQQARRLGHSEQVEHRSLTLHGLLHLLGYDHERFSYKYQGLDQRLTGVLPARVVQELIA